MPSKVEFNDGLKKTAKMARKTKKKGKNNSFFDCGEDLPNFDNITPPFDWGESLPDFPPLPDDLWQRGDLDGIWDDLPEMDWDFPEMDWDFPEMDWDFPEIDWGGAVDNNSEKKTQ